ncbi:MAG: DUF4249 family protein [Bacteroidota bacterium]
MKKVLPILLIPIIFFGCELYQQDEYEEYYVVESYLVANGELPMVRLSTTSPVDETYRFEDNTLSGATVEIHMLNADSSVAESYSYQQQQPGIYMPEDSTIIRDQQLYRLAVTTDNGDEISSTTFVPEHFETINENELEPEYQYQSDKQVQIITTPSSYITDRQTYYVFNVNAINPSENSLTPFYADLVSDDDTQIEEYYVNSSGIINEGNYERNDDNTITLDLPWLSIAFFGPNDIVTNAIDDNLYDFLRSHEAQSGGTTLSPGEIQNIRYNVNGGIGIFGSMASDTNRVFISRPTNSP